MNNDFSSFRVATDDLPAAERIDAMRDIYGRAMLKLDIEPLPGSSFRVDMTLRALPGLGVATGSCSPIRCDHTPELIDGDDLILFVAVAGGGVIAHRGRVAIVVEGEAVLTTSEEPGLHVFHSDSRFVVFRLPYRLISPLVGDLSQLLARPMRSGTEALRLLVGYVGRLHDLQAQPSPELGHLVATHMRDLAAVAIGATRDAAETARGRGVRSARLHAIKVEVIANIGHPLDVAARHGVSPRYFRKLFESEGGSFSDFVLARRLERAYRCLTDPRFADHTISSIAFDAGFGDLSYFNRTFRRRYGASPSEVRLAARRPN